MLRTILLLTPVYISMFWTIVLIVGSRPFDKPKRFLGVFMFVAFVVYASHFLYFTQTSDIYYYIDPLYQLASLISFPLFYIYFRILTIDPGFSIKKHSKYLFLSVLLSFLYLLGYFFADKSFVIPLLYSGERISDNFFVTYLFYMRNAIKILFIIQMLYVIYGNIVLIINYSHQASHFYSDIADTRNLRVKILNILFIVTAIFSIIIAAIGKVSFQDSTIGLAFASIVFSFALFLTGFLGYKQKILNPNYIEVGGGYDLATEYSNYIQQQILEKLLFLFNEQKIFKNNKLNINDVANEIGTNRTYLSTLINNKFSSNFCSFVNEFRIQDLATRIKENPNWTTQMLCENCGFGSVDSMRRAVQLKTGLSINEWKKQLLNKK